MFQVGDRVEIFGCTLFPLKGIVEKGAGSGCYSIGVVDGCGESHLSRSSFDLTGKTILVHRDNLRSIMTPT
jgi:hypothetical protein